MKKNKKNYLGIIISIILILILVIVITKPIISGNAFLQNIFKNSNQNTAPKIQNLISLTKENFPSFLQSQQIIKDLPANSLISLKLYNMEAETKNWEESYIIKKGKVEKGNLENPDIIIYLNSKYIKDLGNICDAAKQAKANGDISYDTKISQLSIMWKYKNMIKYSRCFGL